MKLRLSHKISLIGIVPLFAFVTSVVVQLKREYSELALMRSMSANITMVKAASILIKDLQRERGRTALFLAGGSIFEDVQSLRRDTDRDLPGFETAIAQSTIEQDSRLACDDIRTRLNSLRERYNKQDVTLREREINEYTSIISSLMNAQSAAAQAKTSKGLGKVLASLCLLEEARENSGLLRAHISSLLALNKPLSDDDLSKVLKQKAGVDVNLFSPALAISEKSTLKLDSLQNCKIWRDVEDLVKVLIVKSAQGKFNIAGDEFFKLMTSKIDDIGSLLDNEVQVLERFVEQEKKSATLWLLTISLILAFFIILVSLLIWYYTRSAAARLALITSSLSDIARGEGDLTKRIAVNGGDEISQIAISFNLFVEQMGMLVKQVKVSAAALSTSADSLGQASAQVAQNAQNTSSRSESVAIAAEQMSNSMANAAHNMRRTAEGLASVATATEEMSATIADVAENAQKAMIIGKDAANQTKDVAEHIRLLGDAAQEIGVVTETIAGISAQTNLLALNATIEAARAGAAGKGFAVVASEIKTLAEQTAIATGDIRTRIASIQSLTGNTVNEVGKINNVVTSVDEIISTIATAIEEQATVTRDVAQNIVSATSGAKEADTNVEQTAIASQQTADNINEFNVAASNLTTASAIVSQASAELRKVSEQLNNLVGKFTTE